jgi:hypothetical protein
VAATASTPDIERPLEDRPDIPNRTETYELQAYDPNTEIGVWFHLGTPTYDTSLWEDLAVVYLPGGDELLIGKGFGRRPGTADVSGSMVTADYEESTGDWIVRFHGALQRGSRSELSVRPAIDKRSEPVSCELRYHGLSPVWDMHDEITNQSWANAHWEQPCTVTGWVEVSRQRTTFDGVGVRDHSRGPRDFEGSGQHYWVHGQFPSGKAFGLLWIESNSAQPVLFDKGYLVAGGEIASAHIVKPPPEDRALDEPFDVVLEGPDGQVHIRGEMVHDVVFSVQYPHEWTFGYRTGEAQHHFWEGHARFEWDGEIGYGIVERSVTRAADGAAVTR